MLSDSLPALKVLKVKLNNRENIENVIFSVEVREYEEKWVKFNMKIIICEYYKKFNNLTLKIIYLFNKSSIC
jgi:hypothetical protein